MDLKRLWVLEQNVEICISSIVATHPSMRTRKPPPSMLLLTHTINQKKVGIKVWHQRYGHLNINSLKKLARKNLVDGFSVININEEL